MGRPERLNAYELQQELSHWAARSAAQNDWLGSFLAYSELSSVDGSVQNLVMATETKRLIGLLDVVGFPEGLTISDVVKTLGLRAGESLLAKAVMLKEDLSIEDVALVKDFANESKLICNAIGARILMKGDERLAMPALFKKEKVFNVRDANHILRTVVFSPYRAEVPPLSIVSTALPLTSSQRTVEIESVEVVELKEVRFVAGSELCSVDGILFGDGGTFEDARFRDSQDDEAIFCINQQEVISKNFDASQPLFFDSLFWAAYPTTEAWGEWFIFVLSRLAILTQAYPDETLNVAILDSVPREFISIAEEMFSNLVFIMVGRGQVVHVKRARLVPLWHSTSSREHWSLAGDNLRLQLEPNVSKLLRHIFKSFNLDGGATESKVFFSRSGARYRQGATESVLGQLAEKHRYTSINMGALTVREQVSVAERAKNSFGQCGSNWDLVAVAAERENKAIIIHHDRPHEWQGVAWVYQEFSGQPPQFVLGSRRVPSLGYGAESYHQSVELSRENIEFLDSELGSINSE